MDTTTCIFCNWNDKDRIAVAAETAHFFATYDINPVSKGHSIIVPKKHITSFFALTDQEVVELYTLINQMKEQVDTRHNPDGYNIGINEGEVAGQTIFHLHIHLIPRYKGDVEDPRGGVRHVIPEKGNY